MNESKKRKERLTSAAIPVREQSCALSRFDFYSDPMAAFSSDAKGIKVGNQIAPNNFKHSNTGGFPRARLPSPLSGGPRNPQTTVSPAHQFQRNYSPDQRMHQLQGSYQNFSPQRSPVGMKRPFPMHNGNRPEVWNGAEFRPPGSPQLRPPVTAGYVPQGSPGCRPPGSPGFGPPGSPGFRPPTSPGFRPPISPGFRPPTSPGFRPATSPGFRPPGSRGSNIGRGRGHRFSHSRRPQSVHGGSPSPSSSSGRGGWRGSHGHAMDAQLGLEQFYDESMVEDPWNFLEPVIWKGVDTPLKCLDTPGSSEPSTGRSSSTSISEGSNKSTPKPSLAEFLVASFNEAVNDTPST